MGQLHFILFNFKMLQFSSLIKIHHIEFFIFDLVHTSPIIIKFFNISRQKIILRTLHKIQQNAKHPI